jgi:hypothetical protein
VASSWQKRLTRLWARLTRIETSTVEGRPDVSPTGALARADSNAPVDTRQTISINLGIDFGTSFTKVCFRDVGAERSGVVTFDSSSLEGALIPSVVSVDASGKLYLDAKPRNQRFLVRYLKMRLAGVPLYGGLPEIEGVQPEDSLVCRALASWFLATVVVHSRTWLENDRRDHFRNRRIIWSANVGVPVEHYDSPIIETFKEVLGVAWSWARRDVMPSDLRGAVESYQSSIGGASADVDFHPIPEIAAAVQSFVISRAAVPGVYVYFDIGGGTVDGVAFNFINHEGERRVNFYSGQVSPLGTAAILNKLNPDAPLTDISTELRKRLRRRGRDVQGLEEQIRRLVGYVVMTAKRKDGRNWKDHAIQQVPTDRTRSTRLRQELLKPLIVFVGGGGADVSWYGNAIESTYEAFQHGRAGIPPYQLQVVPQPNDFEMGGFSPEAFNRFAIAYGLSIPLGEAPEIGLPSQFDELPTWAPKRPMAMVDYLDSKDVYD